MKEIRARLEECMENARKHVIDPTFGVGVDRGGNQSVGGPLWMDWDNLEPFTGINQIVGHTSGKEAREKIRPKSRNYCLDVGNGLVTAILADGKLEILKRF
ncbi:hypothetical protein [Chthoniobacter sp.]|uniref:hypothetical protein n=1 Tax=Chthoniobacter sp. TaxID=2510640 RepID=UPI0032AEA34C